VLLLALTACSFTMSGRGERLEWPVDVQASAVTVHSNFVLRIDEEGPTHVFAEENLQDRVLFQTEDDGALHVRFDNLAGYKADEPIEIVLGWTPEILTGMDLSTIDITGATEQAEVFTTENAHIQGDVSLSQLWLNLEAGSSASLTGQVGFLDIYAAGESSLDASELQADHAHVLARNLAEIQVCATDRLQITAQNEATVTYGCSPEELDIFADPGTTVTGDK